MTDAGAAGRVESELRVPIGSGPSTVTPAATVVPLRDSSEGLEVLMLRRNDRGPFGGMWVFPGGRVEPGDATPPGTPTRGGTEAPLAEERVAAARAAVRETAEEAGLDLSLETLVPLSFWLPPPEAPRRFATWFFLAPVTVGDIVVDGQEIFEHRWFRPQAALVERDVEAIRLAPPTYMTLWGLTRHRDVASALRWAEGRPPERFLTRGITSAGGGLLVAMWEGDASYEDGDLARGGPRRRLWLEPSGWRVEISA